MDLADYMAVPYVAVFYSVELPDGTWVRRAEYPELSGCYAEAGDVVLAMDQLEEKRIKYLSEAFRRGEEIPVPRPPLKSGASGLSGRPVVSIMDDIRAGVTK